MPIPAIAIPVIGLISSAFKGWMDARQLKAQDKRAVTESKVAAKIRKNDHLYTMDSNSSNDMRYSWKDEFFVLLLSAPFIMCFIPPLAPYVAQGFAVLKATPQWYQYSFLGAIAATFGLRAWFNKLGI